MPHLGAQIKLLTSIYPYFLSSTKQFYHRGLIMPALDVGTG